MNVFQESIKSLIPIDITHVRIDLKRPQKYSAEFCYYVFIFIDHILNILIFH